MLELVEYQPDKVLLLIHGVDGAGVGETGMSKPCA
jgi:hypothetical protein